MIEFSRDAQLPVRLRVVELLGESGGVQVVPWLIEALKNSNQKVRWRAVEGLGQVGE